MTLKKNIIQVLKSAFMVLLCAVIIAVPVLDSYRAYAISETVLVVGGVISICAALGIIQGSIGGTTENLVTDPYIRQKVSSFGQTIVDGAKVNFRWTIGQLKRFKAYVSDRLGLAHNVPTTVPTTEESVSVPEVFQFSFAEYPASNIVYSSDGVTVNKINYDASFLDSHILWGSGNTASSIDSREDSYYSSLGESCYFTASTSRQSWQVYSNIIWTLPGDLRYTLSVNGSTYGTSVKWKCFEPLYFVNTGTGNRELLLSAIMTNRNGEADRFVYMSSPSLDYALNVNASSWYPNSSDPPPLVGLFGNFTPVLYKTYSQTARNYREYAYTCYDGVAPVPTTSQVYTTDPDLSTLTNELHYDSDYDVTEKITDDNTYVNIPLTPAAKKLGEAVEDGTPVASLSSGVKAQIRNIPSDVHQSMTVGGTVTTTEAVTDGTGSVVSPAVSTLTGDVPINDYLDSSVTETGEYQGLISRIASTVRSILDTVKSIPQTITDTGQTIVDSIDYQLNPNSPQFDNNFITFFTSAISSKFPSVQLFNQAFNGFAASDSPLVLEYDIVLGSRQYHFSADFSWFEAHRARFRSGVGVLFWLLAWLGVLRGFLSIFHISLGKVGGLGLGNTSAGGSPGATALDIGNTGSIPVDSVEYGIWKSQGRL